MSRARRKLNLTPEALNEVAVFRHLEHLALRNLRDNSQNNRKRVLRRLADWAGGPVLYLTADQLKEWQRARAREVKPQTLRMELSGMREFYKWAVKERLRHDDPTIYLDMPRVSKRGPRPMTEADLAYAIAGAPWDIEAILSLAAFAGLRACEIARLDWSEVVMSGPYHYLTVSDGKGGKTRHVPLSTLLIEVLNRSSQRRGPIVPRRDGAHGACEPHRISAIANDYLHGLDIRASLHQCRHRFATATYAACRDIRTVQELLGHSSPTTTAVYAAVAPDVAIAAVEAAARVAAA